MKKRLLQYRGRLIPIFLSIFVIFILIYISSPFLGKNFLFSKYEHKYGNYTATNNSDNLYFLTYDQLKSNYSTDIYTSSSTLESLKILNSSLHSQFDFYELSTQPVYYIGEYSGDSKFCDLPEGNTALINQKGIDASGNPITVTPLRTVLLGKDFSTYLDGMLSEGKNFDASDYVVHNPNQNINIIMGQEYKELYSIGDTIQLSLLEKTINFNVLGFLEENSSIYTKVIMTQQTPSEILLDNAIIIPYYDINYLPSDYIEQVYQSRFYLQKNSGYIKMDCGHDSDTTHKEEIEQLASLLEDEGFENPFLYEYFYYTDIVESTTQEMQIPYSVSLSPVSISFSLIPQQ